MSDVMPPRLHRRTAMDRPTDGVGPVVDPTKNVLDLVDAAVMRIDDMAALRAELADEKIKRMEGECLHLEQMAGLREQHAQSARESEAKRLDAIRATDAANVSTTAAQSLAAIQALAGTQATAAETLRNQVSTTATTIANQTDRIVSPIMERLAALEKIVNIGQGRSTVADPQISELMTEMRKLSTSRDLGAGKSEGFDKSWALLGGGILLALAIYGGVFKGPAPAPAPQIVVVPAGTPTPGAVQSGPPTQVTR